MKFNFLTAPVIIFRNGVYVKAYVLYLASFFLGAWIL